MDIPGFTQDGNQWHVMIQIIRNLDPFARLSILTDVSLSENLTSNYILKLILKRIGQVQSMKLR